MEQGGTYRVPPPPLSQDKGPKSPIEATLPLEPFLERIFQSQPYAVPQLAYSSPGQWIGLLLGWRYFPAHCTYVRISAIYFVHYVVSMKVFI